MPESSQQSDCSRSGLPGSTPRASRVVIHLTLVPRQTVSWRLTADAELQAHDTRIWLTRIHSPYDYWMQRGDCVRVCRGERIWLSAEGDGPAEVTLTSAYVERGARVRRWATYWRDLVFALLAPRPN